MAKKSKAQIQRMIKRAQARGEVYHHPPPAPEPAPTTSDDAAEPIKEDAKRKGNKSSSSKDNEKLQAAKKLSDEIFAIDNDPNLRSKDRRSAKRKAEAIAQEATGCTAAELLEWYEKHKDEQQEGDAVEKKRKRNPYILFIGQLAYSTTSQSLFEHFKAELGEEHKITESTVHIRLLTDAKTKKSRGMAFVELSDPETMYACLKLHHTMLEGRRINVERSAGGGRNSENRKAKLKQYRAEQDEYMTSTVNQMVEEYKKSGEIRDGELDEGVLALCTRHSAAVVQAALERYVESNGRDMDNSSAYFTFLLGKLASEGIFDDEKRKSSKSGDGGGERPRKRQAQSRRGADGEKGPSEQTGTFAQKGIDMNAASSSSGGRDYSKIFPSMGRGRGRGRGRAMS